MYSVTLKAKCNRALITVVLGFKNTKNKTKHFLILKILRNINNNVKIREFLKT